MLEERKTELLKAIINKIKTEYDKKDLINFLRSCSATDTEITELTGYESIRARIKRLKAEHKL